MKKTITLVLLLMLVCVAVFAIADETSEPNYEGAWVPLGSSGYQVFLPIDWVIFQPEGDEIFAAGTADLSQYMAVERLQNKDYSNEAILAELKAKSGHTGVQPITYNRRVFITYNVAANNMFGAATLSSDGDSVFLFKFTPYSDLALGSLAVKIMTSFAPNQ